MEIVRYHFLSYPFHFINDSKSAIQCNLTNATEMTQVSVTTINSALFDQKYAIQCNLTNATEMTQVSVTTINSALFDQKIYRGYLHNAFLVVLLSAFFISKNTTCIGML